MATYPLLIASEWTDSGDDVYAKPADSDFSGIAWPANCVSAEEIANTNIYTVELDDAQSYVICRAAGSPRSIADQVIGTAAMRYAPDYYGARQIDITPGRSQSVHLEIDQLGEVQIPAYREDGTPVSWYGKTLQFQVSDRTGTRLATSEHAEIAVASGSFRVTLTPELTAKRRTLHWRMIDTTDQTEILQGLFPVY